MGSCLTPLAQGRTETASHFGTLVWVWLAIGIALIDDANITRTNDLPTEFARNAFIVQFSEGLLTLSTTSTSTGALPESTFNPN